MRSSRIVLPHGARKKSRADVMIDGWMDFEGCATEMKSGFCGRCEEYGAVNDQMHDLCDFHAQIWCGSCATRARMRRFLERLPSFVVISIFLPIFIMFSSSAPQAPHSPPHSARTTSFPPTKIAPFPVDHIWNVDLWRSTKNMGAIKMDGWIWRVVR